jgi:hypothetical protein
MSLADWDKKSTGRNFNSASGENIPSLLILF